MESIEVKVVILGDSGFKYIKGVGKTSLLYRFARNIFNDNVVPTIGAAFMAKNITYKNKNIKF